MLIYKKYPKKFEINFFYHTFVRNFIMNEL
jgi:hypothetical protein